MFVSVPHVVCAVVAGTVMRMLLFVLNMSMLSARLTAMTVSTGHQYVGGTRGSGIVSGAADVLGMRGASGVCVWLGSVWDVSK